MKLFRYSVLCVIGLLVIACGKNDETSPEIADNGTASVTITKGDSRETLETTKNLAAILSENGFLTLTFFLNHDPDKTFVIGYLDDFEQVSVGDVLQSDFGFLSVTYIDTEQNISAGGPDIRLTITQLDRDAKTFSGRFEFVATDTNASVDEIVNGDADISGTGEFEAVAYTIN